VRQLKQITDTREALEKMIQDDLSAGVAALSVTTRGAGLKGTGWQHADDGVRSIRIPEANASGLSMAAGATSSQAQITPAQHQVHMERADTPNAVLHEVGVRVCMCVRESQCVRVYVCVFVCLVRVAWRMHALPWHARHAPVSYLFEIRKHLTG
jgi:hypothetical protein